jgi:hypothetical protein
MNYRLTKIVLSRCGACANYAGRSKLSLGMAVVAMLGGALAQARGMAPIGVFED